MNKGKGSWRKTFLWIKRFCVNFERCIWSLFSSQDLKRSGSEIPLCAYGMCFLINISMWKRLQVWKKEIIETCDWLFPAWHLVVIWENCSFWPRGDLWEKPQEGKYIFELIVFCIHMRLQIFLRTWMDLRSDSRKLKGRLW